MKQVSPNRRAALIPVLTLADREFGYLSREAMTQIGLVAAGLPKGYTPPMSPARRSTYPR